MSLVVRADRPKVPQTLLLADDSVTIQRVIELTFADEDIDVVAVSDGDLAIARLDAVPPDIVLVDVGMPGKSGYEVAAYVKQSPRLSHIPVVLLTGAFEPVDEARAAGAGCDGVLAKPFEPQLVIGRVKELLNRQAPVRSGAGGDQDAAAVVAEPDDGAKAIDDYFDQLDAAFSNLAGKSQGVSTTVSPQIDWFGLKNAVPASTPEPEPPVHTPSEEPVRAAAAREGALPAPQPAPPPASVPPREPAAASPPLADAFAAMLEAKRGGPQPTPAPLPAQAAAPGPLVLTDDLVARVSARVLEQLTDRVVRQTVAEIAERLVRAEIERIKDSIR